MNVTEKRRRPITAHVLLRPCDKDAVSLILETLRDVGLVVGKGTVSDAIRYAINFTAGSLATSPTGPADRHTG